MKTKNNNPENVSVETNKAETDQTPTKAKKQKTKENPQVSFTLGARARIRHSK
jgi:hypothetical protein